MHHSFGLWMEFVFYVPTLILPNAKQEKAENMKYFVNITGCIQVAVENEQNSTRSSQLKMIC